MQRSPKYKIRSFNLQIGAGLLTWIDFNQSM